MKKILYGVVLVLLIGIIFWFYTGLNGNSMSKAQAEKDMKVYLQENYPDKDFELGPVGYSMSFGGYMAVVTSKSDSSISFNLSWRKGAKVIYDEYIYKYSKDEALSKKFADEITERLKTILRSDIKGFNDVSSEIYIKKGVYNSSDSFRVDMPEKITVWVYMKGDKISKEEFVERCVKARDLIAKEGYKIDTYSFHYNTSFAGDVKGGGQELYSLALGKSLLNASKDDILKSNKLSINTGKGRMIAADIIYKGSITLFILGIIGAGVFIARKEKKEKVK
ncbi:hypothetical protein [Clostridium omnivorum]|uniref:Uncharacterized protein n=1 Tax=Clostridium omnivorum TaxID=1604902 RepID=A0ABQ5N9G0_9CLOT|nr:hypothetical protein [Clostridium sp. E14]GLC31850.1 hypothetical protein bsdE14_32600 [Clostridium sp. E14]